MPFPHPWDDLGGFPVITVSIVSHDQAVEVERLLQTLAQHLPAGRLQIVVTEIKSGATPPRNRVGSEKLKPRSF